MRIMTSGESHGPGMTVIIDGYPSRVNIDIEIINAALQARMKGPGRGARMAIENDQVEILSGIRFGKSIGSPITLFVRNRDYANWQDDMASQGDAVDSDKGRTTVRPGHADYAGALKFGHQRDVRNVLERASARSSVAYVAAGSLAEILLRELGIEVHAEVLQIGDKLITGLSDTEYAEIIESVRHAKDTIGGKVIVRASGLPIGLGNYSQWSQKLDARIASAMMSIPTTKAVEIGAGVQAATLRGSELHDELFLDEAGNVFRKSNNAGGIEGGVSNGEDIVVSLTSKPIPTLMQPLNSIDLNSNEAATAFVERSDVSVLEAYAVIARSMLAIVLAEIICEQYQSDTLVQLVNIFEELKGMNRDDE
ncbi:chorismate synthase [Culicoidibacter larvae]|uniref:Chorismate synthase n=1 Tax=Culicoidibacter larvae TaxID=2579976 RepID=A0A5R8QGL5_9FIRM|nr:chorismate synthase [Culicoidibacter larvae]TLG76603.1 chorismate synthase [Culicoidibacter larvae]